MFLSGIVNAQEVVGDVYGEFYSDKKSQTYISNTFQLLGYSGIMGLESIDAEESIPYDGFQLELVFAVYNDSIRNVYINAFEELDEGLVRIRIWDTKLYGYCYVGQIVSNTDSFIITLFGRKNVPQRKKLLFKDSSRLRFNSKYPWQGK